MRIRMRKPHACGGNEWRITRTGADIGVECGQCGRRVVLSREEFQRRLAQVLTVPPLHPAADPEECSS
jgi:hypothetical protein